MRSLVLLLLLLPGLAFGATSNVFSSARDRVRLISASNAPSGGQVQLALVFQLQPGWHIYWSNPGDAGFPPELVPAAPVTASGFDFPPPSLLLQGPIAAYVLSGHVILPFTATRAGSTISAVANWLVCSDVCVPEHATFNLVLNGGMSAEAALFPAPQIVASPFPASLAPDGTLSITGPSAAEVVAAHFYPAAPGALVNAAPQALNFTPSGLTLKLTLLPGGGKSLEGFLELTDKSGAMQALAVTPEAALPLAHPPYLLLAFLGGLILNLMPCVFPILALKALAIARMGGGAKIRDEAFGYTAGVVAAMLFLAGVLLLLRTLGIAAGWGFQFQSPIFVAVTAWLIFAIALNLAGVFDIAAPAVFGRIPAQNSILTGILAVAVATPCTAPFMGGAVAAALTAPVFDALGIFLALGLGMALPFLLLALVPRLAGFIPRPGPWMLWLQRTLSLPMAATCLWLAWVLYRQAGVPGLWLLGLGAVLLLLALTRKTLRPLAFACLLLLPFLRTDAAANPLSLPGAQPYSADRLAALRAQNTPVFIDLTAAWCVTCLVNEATTLKNPQVQTSFSARHVAVLVGDWTDKDASITALLTANHRDGVPLYLYYPPGSAAPTLLPQVLDPGIVKAAIASR